MAFFPPLFGHGSSWMSGETDWFILKRDATRSNSSLTTISLVVVLLLFQVFQANHSPSHVLFGKLCRIFCLLRGGTQGTVAARSWPYRLIGGTVIAIDDAYGWSVTEMPCE